MKPIIYTLFMDSKQNLFLYFYSERKIWILSFSIIHIPVFLQYENEYGVKEKLVLLSFSNEHAVAKGSCWTFKFTGYTDIYQKEQFVLATVLTVIHDCLSSFFIFLWELINYTCFLSLEWQSRSLKVFFSNWISAQILRFFNFFNIKINIPM